MLILKMHCTVKKIAKNDIAIHPDYVKYCALLRKVDTFNVIIY